MSELKLELTEEYVRRERESIDIYCECDECKLSRDWLAMAAEIARLRGRLAAVRGRMQGYISGCREEKTGTTYCLKCVILLDLIKVIDAREEVGDGGAGKEA